MAEPDKNAVQAAENTGYRVLARKYRPASFADLIGQDAMVRTISNAFETGRIPQAWILTGVRGVGKTTTARILARALNYELPDGSVKEPTVAMPAMGVHCQAIIESRHIDVLEMDAASHNSVEDVRQINDAIRYAPVSARYKVYILDEVHMLSGAAFNALLKTLEEPPPHAKFIFATTEIRKVPVTVLSRCQRFDLRRVDAALLVKHLESIAAKEHIEVEPAALALLARAAEGSVRDSLSLLDQAIAHAGAETGAGQVENAAGRVRAEDVRQMLGLADRVRVVDLFEALMKGDTAAALNELREQYDIGADPAVILSDLAEFTHFVTRVKVVPRCRRRRLAVGGRAHARPRLRRPALHARSVARLADAAEGHDGGSGFRPPGCRRRDGPHSHRLCRRSADAGRGRCVRLSRRAARRRVRRAMAGLRKPPRKIMRRVTMRRAARRAPPPRFRRARPTTRWRKSLTRAPTLAVASFEQIVALAAEKRDVPVKLVLERDVRLVRCEDGQLEIALEPSAPKTFVHDLQRKLTAWTGKRWIVVVSQGAGRRRRCARRWMRARPRSSAACRPTRWCRRCSTASPAPRSWA